MKRIINKKLLRTVLPTVLICQEVVCSSLYAMSMDDLERAGLSIHSVTLNDHTVSIINQRPITFSCLQPQCKLILEEVDPQHGTLVVKGTLEGENLDRRVIALGDTGQESNPPLEPLVRSSTDLRDLRNKLNSLEYYEIFSYVSGQLNIKLRGRSLGKALRPRSIISVRPQLIGMGESAERTRPGSTALTVMINTVYGAENNHLLTVDSFEHEMVSNFHGGEVRGYRRIDEGGVDEFGILYEGRKKFIEYTTLPESYREKWEVSPPACQAAS